MDRRKYLVTAGAVGIASLAGCTGNEDDEEETDEKSEKTEEAEKTEKTELSDEEQRVEIVESAAGGDAELLTIQEYEHAEGLVLHIDIRINARFEDRESRGTSASYNIFETLFNSEYNIERVVTYGYILGEDNAGNEVDVYVSNIVLDRNTAQNVSWDSENIYSPSYDNYYIAVSFNKMKKLFKREIFEKISGSDITMSENVVELSYTGLESSEVEYISEKFKNIFVAANDVPDLEVTVDHFDEFDSWSVDSQWVVDVFNKEISFDEYFSKVGETTK